MKAAKEGLLKERENEKRNWKLREKEKRTLVANLQRNRKVCKAEVNKKRREANQLNARIDRLIAEEIERARKRAAEEARREAAARKKADTNDKGASETGTAAKPKSEPLDAFTMSKADRELSGSFCCQSWKTSDAYIRTLYHNQPLWTVFR